MEVTYTKKKLSVRERKFCLMFVRTGDAELAAKAAGYTGDCLEQGQRLLGTESVLGEINRLNKSFRPLLGVMAEAGYRRLALGSAADAVRLLFLDSPCAETLAEMDLGIISEIKRKDGAMEIKFFDRLKALDGLAALAEDSQESGDLFEAISRGAVCAGDDDVD